MAVSRSELLQSTINGGMRKNIGGMFMSVSKRGRKNSWGQGGGDLFGSAFLTLYFDFPTIAEVCSINFNDGGNSK